MRKNIIVIMALMVMLFQSGLTVKAADYKDKEFSSRVHILPEHIKRV